MVRTLLFALSSVFLALAFAPSTSAQDKQAQFRTQFDAASKLGDRKKMDGLMRRMEDQAIDALVGTAEAISNAPNDMLYDRYNALRDSWNRVHKTEFPDNMESFFANLSSSMKVERRRLRDRYQKSARKSFDSREAKDADALNFVATEMEALANAFEELGDFWMESQSALGAAAALEERFHGKKTNFTRVATNFERMIARRDLVGVKDQYYDTAVPRVKTLNGLGFGSGAAKRVDANGDVIDEPVGPVAESAGSAITSKMEFKQFKDMKDTMRPNFYLDMHFQIWPAVNLKGADSTTTIPRLENGPSVIREGASKVMVDVDGDGEGDTQWPTRGKLEAITFELGDGATKRPWSVFTQVGRQQDFYQGQTMNLGATDDAFALYYAPGGAMAGEVSGVEIELIDDDMDGNYGSLPKPYRHVGLVEGGEQLDFDSIRVDGEKKARPFSEYVNLGKAGWHKLEAQNGGTTVAAEPFTFKTGTLQLKGKGVKPDFYIIKGSGETLSNTYIDISGGKKVEVPVGRWELVWGLARTGKKMQLVKASILGSNASPALDVTEGADVVVTFGSPYSFDFDYEPGAEAVTVQGPSVAVRGVGGEVYDRFYGAVPRPQASLRKVGSKKGSASVKMRPAESQDELAKYGWKAMWKPLVAELPKKAAEVQVQLFEKKNKLFGKIESDWK